MKKTKKLEARKLSFETIEGSLHNVITTGNFTEEYKETVEVLAKLGLIEKATIDNEALTEEKLLNEIKDTEAIIVNPVMLWRYIKEKAMDDKILTEFQNEIFLKLK